MAPQREQPRKPWYSAIGSAIGNIIPLMTSRKGGDPNKSPETCSITTANDRIIQQLESRTEERAEQVTQSVWKATGGASLQRSSNPIEYKDAIKDNNIIEGKHSTEKRSSIGDPGSIKDSNLVDSNSIEARRSVENRHPTTIKDAASTRLKPVRRVRVLDGIKIHCKRHWRVLKRRRRRKYIWLCSIPGHSVEVNRIEYERSRNNGWEISKHQNHVKMEEIECRNSALNRPARYDKERYIHSALDDPLDLDKVRHTAYSRAILSTWEILNGILSQHEVTINKRWSRKSNKKRKDILLRAWRDMNKQHAPDYDAICKLTSGGFLGSQLDQTSILWPHINLEDLSKKRNLLLLLNSRGHNSPHLFALSDCLKMRGIGLLSAMSNLQPQVNKQRGVNHQPEVNHLNHNMLITNYNGEYGTVQCDKVNSSIIVPGRLIPDVVDSSARFFGRGISPDIGIVLLGVQLRILVFLARISRIILQDIPLYRVDGSQMAHGTHTTKISGYQAKNLDIGAMRVAVAYGIPGNINFERILEIVGSKQAALEDNLWFLRENPEYFFNQVSQVVQHFGVMDTAPDAIMSCSIIDTLYFAHMKFGLWSIIHNQLHELHRAYQFWKSSSETRHDVRTKFSRQVLLTQFGLQLLYTTYKSQIASLYLKRNSSASSPTSSNRRDKMPMFEFVSNNTGRKRQMFKFGSDNTADKKPMFELLSKNSGDKDTKSGLDRHPDDDLSVFLSNFVRGFKNTDNDSIDQQVKVINESPIFMTDALQGILERDPTSQDHLSSIFRDNLSDLRIIGLVEEALMCYLDPMTKERIERLAPPAFTRKWKDRNYEPMHRYLDHLRCLDHGTAIKPISNLHIPSNDDTEAGTNRVREAEAHLDAYWAWLDAKIRELEGASLFEFISKWFRQERDLSKLKRTSPWVQPESSPHEEVNTKEVVDTNEAVAKSAGAKPKGETEAQEEIDTHGYMEESIGAEEDSDIEDILAPEETDGTDTIVSAPAPEPNTQPCDPKPEGIIIERPQNTRKIKLKPRQFIVFKTLFFQKGSANPPGDIPWTEFITAMTVMNFKVEHLYGSIWRFTPMPDTIEADEVGRGILIHQPHPSSRITLGKARTMGRRLNKTYGWHGEMFEED